MSISTAAPAPESPFTSRKLALGALLLGCALTLIAPFLPIAYVSYIFNLDPINDIPHSKTPAQDFLTKGLLSPATGAVVAFVVAFALWGIPVIMTALSARMLLMRGRASSWRAGVPFLVLAVIGAVIASLECVAYLFSEAGHSGTRVTLMYGAGVTFVGYLFVLVGAIFLMASPTPAAPAASAAPAAPTAPADARRARWLAGGALLLSLALPVIGQYPVIRIFRLEYAPWSLFGFPNLGYPWLGFWFLLFLFLNGWLLALVVALALLFVVAPIVLAVLGVVTLSARSWIPGRRAIILGAVVTALGAASAFFPHLIVSLGLSASIPLGSGSLSPITAFEALPMLLGYLAALVGVILLPRISGSSQTS
jgi:hypothetical protein